MRIGRIGLCGAEVYFVRLIDGLSCRLQNFTSGDMPNLQVGGRMQLSQPLASVGSSVKLQHTIHHNSACKLHRIAEHLLHQLYGLEAHQLRHCIQG